MILFKEKYFPSDFDSFRLLFKFINFTYYFSMKNIKSIYSFIIICLFSLSFSSCGKTGRGEKSELTFFKVESADFSRYINQKQAPKDPNIYEDITLYNNEYPIEITLYKDGRWFYHLANLDDGFGTWKFEDGKIKLFATRTLFDMYIDIEAREKNAKDVAIRFSDRFGEKVLLMNKRNIEEEVDSNESLTL